MKMNFYKFFSILLLTTAVLPAYTQRTGIKAYFVQFTDKKNTKYTVNSPLEFLSQRCLDRRLKNGIPITEEDFPVNSWYLDSLRAYGAKILLTSRWFNSATVELESDSLLTLIQKLPFVKKTEKVFRSAKTNSYEVVTESPLFTDNPDKEYGLSWKQVAQLNGHFLHQMNYRGQGVLIAVIDAGFFKVERLSAFSHLYDSNRILGTWDFVSGNDSVYKTATHGQVVLSAIAANMPGKLIGTSTHASFLLLRSENGDSEYLIEEDAWVAAAEYADSAGADIINSSLGYSTFDDKEMNHTYAQMNGNTTKVTIGADIAARKGILVVSSAGNLGGSKWKYISAPADGDSVLAVGAIDERGNYAYFSSIGPSSDGDVKPNVVAMGVKTVVTSSTDGETDFTGGTSLAAPLISGMAACLMSAFPEKSAMVIKKAIEKSSNLYALPNPYFGYGIPDFKLAYQILKLPEQKDLGEIGIMELYPNPFSEKLFITYFSRHDQDVTLTVTDLAGKLIAEKKSEMNAGQVEKIVVDMPANLNSGIYIVRLSSDKQVIMKKITKM